MLPYLCLLNLLIILCESRLHPCIWVEQPESTSILSRLARPQHGLCDYKLADDDNADASMRDVIILFSGDGIWGEQEIMIECNGQTNANGARYCYFVSAELNLNKQYSLEAYLQSEISSSVNQLQVLFQKKLRSDRPNNSEKIVQQRQIKIRNATFETSSFDYFKIDAMIKLVALLVCFVVVVATSNEPICSSYELLQLFIFLLVLRICYYCLTGPASIIYFTAFDLSTAFYGAYVICSLAIGALIITKLSIYAQFGYPKFEGRPFSQSFLLLERGLERGSESRCRTLVRKAIIWIYSLILSWENQSNIQKRILMAIMVQMLGILDLYILSDLLVKSLVIVILPIIICFYYLRPSDNISAESDMEGLIVDGNPKYRKLAILSTRKIHCFYALFLLQFLVRWNLVYGILEIAIISAIIMIVWWIEATLLTIYLGIRLGKSVIATTSSEYKQKTQKNKKEQDLPFSQQTSDWHADSIKPTAQIETECSICLESIDGQECLKTECNHIFHRKCLISWVKVKMICPIDRNYLNIDSDMLDH